jgi:large subunit ribosomal protein L1
MVRGIVHCLTEQEKTVRVLVFCTPDKVEEAKDAGADHVGLDDYIEKIKGWLDRRRCNYYNAAGYGKIR